MTKEQELAGKLRSHREKMKAVIDEAGGYETLDFSKVTSLEGADVPAKMEKWDALVKELNDLNDEHAKYHAIEAEARKNEAGLNELNRPVNALPNPHVDENGKIVSGSGRMVKTIGEMIAESDAFKGYDPKSRGSAGGRLEVDQKTLMTTTAGIPVSAPVPTRVQTAGAPRLMVSDLIPQITTDAGMAAWIEEISNTNNAGFTAEGVLKGESAIAFERKEMTMRKVAHWIPVTTEEILLVPRFEAIINGRMKNMLDLKMDVGLVSGDGIAPNLLGFTQHPNVLTQAQGADNNIDAIYKGMDKVRIGAAFAEPTAVAIHPTNFQPIRLMREGAGTGMYIWGPPSEAGTDRVWGKPAVLTTALTVGTALTGDFANYSEIEFNNGIRWEIGYINAQFVENEKTLLMERFLVLKIFNGAAFCVITGLD